MKKSEAKGSLAYCKEGYYMSLFAMQLIQVTAIFIQ